VHLLSFLLTCQHLLLLVPPRLPQLALLLQQLPQRPPLWLPRWQQPPLQSCWACSNRGGGRLVNLRNTG
jgi:hypothetical protein